MLKPLVLKRLPTERLLPAKNLRTLGRKGGQFNSMSKIEKNIPTPEIF